jgi:WD40 repeat protein
MAAAPDIANQSGDPAAYKYWVFLSYSHVDERWASWLHRSLEQYRVPRGLIGRASRFGPLPKRLFPVFRDRDELASASSLSQEILQALRQARFLVVICSPNSAVSRWVNEEIKEFKKLGRNDRVRAIIVDGEPYASDRPDLGLLEAFPKALRFHVDQDGNVTGDRMEPIAADARTHGDGKSAALLKLLSGILGVDYDELRQRERRRRIRRSLALAAGTLAVLAGLAGFWMNRQHAVRQQEQIAFAQRLATAAQQSVGASGIDLSRRVLLAIESLKRAHTPQGHAALLSAMALLPFKHAEFAHDGDVETLSFSPDGVLLAAAGKNTEAATGDGIEPRTVRVWDLASSSEVLTVQVRDYVQTLAISPDRSLLFVSAIAGNARVWDLKTGREHAPLLHDGPEGFIDALALSPDGKLVVTANSASLRVWESRSGKPLWKRSPGSSGGIVFNPDGSLLAAALQPASGQPSGVVLLDLMTRREAILPHQQPVYSLAFSNDGTRLAAGGDSVVVWNAKTRTPIREFPQQAEAIGFRVDGNQLLAATRSYGQLWDIESGQRVNRVEYTGPFGEANSVTLDPSGTKLATAIGEAVRLWDVSHGTEIARLPHNGWVTSVAFSRDGARIATGSDDARVRLWSAQPGTAIMLRQGSALESWPAENFPLSGNPRTITVGGKTLWIWETADGKQVLEKPLAQEANSVVFSPIGALIAATSDNTVSVFDAATLEKKLSLPHGEPIWNARFSPDGKELFTQSGKEIRGWTLDTGREARRFEHEDTVEAFALSPDGARLATSSGVITQLWDARTGTIQHQLSFQGPVRSIAFNRDGAFLATVSGSGVRLWNARNAELLTVLRHDNLVGGALINPRDDGLLTFADDQAILWEPRGKRERARLAHASYIAGAAFDAKGDNAVIWGGDTVRIWGIANGKEVATFNFGDEIEAAAFSPDAKYLIVMHYGGEVGMHFWRPEDLMEDACGRVGRNLTEKEWQTYLGSEPYRSTCPP